jgi:hypothetical protein
MPGPSWYGLAASMWDLQGDQVARDHKSAREHKSDGAYAFFRLMVLAR